MIDTIIQKINQEDNLVKSISDRYSPYRVFTAQEWSEFRADTPLTLTFDEIKRLRSIDDPIDLEEVQRIYLSLSRLLLCHVEAVQELFFTNVNSFSIKKRLENTLYYWNCWFRSSRKIYHRSYPSRTVETLDI